MWSYTTAAILSATSVPLAGRDSYPGVHDPVQLPPPTSSGNSH